MSVETAFRAAGVPPRVARAEAARCSAAMLERDIASQPRGRMFLAQVLHESGGLAFFEEIASGAAYEGRVDLGNTHPGDGRRFKGRGPLQITGRANYKAFGATLGLPLEDEPELAARHDVGWRLAALYWELRGLNELADQDLFVTITRRINGGTRGLADRMHYLQVVSRHDCVPERPDPLAHLTARERELCHAYDRLAASGGDPTRTTTLREEMTLQRKRIWRAAQATGWDAEHRAGRYRSLRARTR